MKQTRPAIGALLLIALVVGTVALTTEPQTETVEHGPVIVAAGPDQYVSWDAELVAYNAAVVVEAERVAAEEAARAEAERAAVARLSPAQVQRIQSRCAGDFECFKACTLPIESGGNYDAVDPSGTYRGAWQFDLNTWRGAVERAGFPQYSGADPATVPPEVQDAAARQLYAERGNQPWGGRC